MTLCKQIYLRIFYALILDCTSYMLIACLPLNYIPTKKFTDLLVQKRSGGLLFNQIVTT